MWEETKRWWKDTPGYIKIVDSVWTVVVLFLLWVLVCLIGSL